MFNKLLLATCLVFGLSSSVLAQGLTPSISQVITPPSSSNDSGGTVTSISNSDGTITLSINPCIAACTISLALGHANTWTALQKFTFGDLALLGSSTGYSLVESGLSGSSNQTLLLPPETSDTLVDLTGIQTFTNKTITFSGNTLTGVAPIASPTFTGVVTFPSPFTLGVTSVTSTGTQFNYLNAATGTTGTTSTNIVFSTSPTLVTPALGAATATSLAATAAIGTTGGGSASTPGLYVGTTGYGLYEPAGSELGISINGAVQLDYGITNSGAWTSNKQLVAAPGASGAPGLAVRSTTYGMYSPAANQLGLSANGTVVFDYGVSTASTVTLATATTLSNATIKLSGLATSSAAQTGTVCSGTGGLLTVDTTTTCLLSVPWLKDILGRIDPKQALKEGLKLEPIWFSWKKGTAEWNGDKQVQPGFNAVQVSKIDKRLAAYDPKGKLHGVRYQEIVAFQQAEIDELQKEIEELKTH